MSNTQWIACLFGFIFLSFVIAALIVYFNCPKIKQNDIYSGDYIGFEDYSYINLWEVKLLEPITLEGIANLDLFEPIYK